MVDFKNFESWLSNVFEDLGDDNLLNKRNGSGLEYCSCSITL